MSKYTSFYKVIEEQGGVLDPTTLPSYLQYLARLALNTCTEIRDNINNSDILYPLGDVRIEIINNDNFNAFAHDDGGYEGLAIYSGLFVRLCELSVSLWSDEGIFCTPSVGSRAKVVLEKLVADEQIKQWQTFGRKKLSDKDIAMRRINTALIGFIFIIMHEVGHLVRAHIPFLSRGSTLKLNTLFERNNKIDNVVLIEKLQILEIEADMHAIRAVTDLAMTTWGMDKIFPINFPYSKGDIFQYLLDIYRGVLLAIFSLYPYSMDTELESIGTHPSPGVRCGVACLGSGDLLSHPFKVSEKVALGAFIAASMEIGDLFTKHGVNAVTLEHDLTVLLKIADEKLVQVFDLRAALKPMIDNRIRSMGADPAHFDQFSDFYKRK